MTFDLDSATQQIVDDFDALAKKRAAELLLKPDSRGVELNEALQAVRESTFCFGYKAGVVDLGASLREQHGVSVDQMAAVFTAACAWRDATPVLAGEIADGPERRLIAAIDAVRKGHQP